MAERLARHADWLPVNEALARILAAVEPLPPERVPLLDALGRTLAEPIHSPVDQPPWDSSGMDGFAVRAADIAGARPDSPVALELAGAVPAGDFPSRPLRPGQAIRVMTGAPIPEGADSVVRREHTAEQDGRVLVLDDADAGRNVRRRASDLRAGELLLAPGRVLRPAELALIAAAGRSHVAVHRRPRIAILATGNELAALDQFHEVLAGRRIVDSNSHALAAAVLATGGVPSLLGIARDDEASLLEHLRAGLDADALITVGGVSVGDHDLVKPALEAFGFRLDFWRVRMRPGSPFSFGRLGRVPAFGLPGNPVSALVTFEVLVRPAIRRMLGRQAVHTPTLRVRAGEQITAPAGLTCFLRARLEPDGPGGWIARLTGPQGSWILSSMAGADALVVVPEATETIQPGEWITAMRLSPSDDAQAEPGY